MGLLTFSINVTLDGCVDHQEGIADDETHAFFTRLMADAGAMLWGRVTYEMMESSWPAVARGEVDVPPAMRAWADTLEAKPKYVVSSTRTDFPWTHSHHLAGDLHARSGGFGFDFVHRPLELDGGPGAGVVQPRQQLDHRQVVAAAFDRQGALSRRRHHVERAEVLGDRPGQAESVQAGGRQHHCVQILADASQPGIDVAANVGHPQVWTGQCQLRRPAG